MIPNPNAVLAGPPELPEAQRQAVLQALRLMIARWPAVDDEGRAITHITVGEMVSRLRRAAPAGVGPDQVSERLVRTLLREAGLLTA